MIKPGSDPDIAYCTAQDLKQLYQARDLSPVDVMSSILRRIETLNPSLNAFSVVMAEEAMEQARRSEGRIAKAEARPLEGVPVTIKDSYEVKGQESETGCFAVRRGVAEKDNPVVHRLRHAGAVIFGKTTMSELAWSGISRNPVNGVTHNPWSHGLNAGASSAGAAVAAAAGFGPLHLGSDGAGSIRMPAHFCGVFGHKPTYGRIPHISVSNNDYGTHIGPMSRSAADSALMLKIMAGPHYLDHTCCEAPPEEYDNKLSVSIKGKKIAFSADLGHAQVDPEITSLVENAVDIFISDLGANVREITPEWGPEGREIGRFFWSALQARSAKYLDQWEDKMGPDLVACIKYGANYSANDYLDARERKYAYVSKISATFEDWDYLITPAVSVAAFPVDLVVPAHWEPQDWDWLTWAQFSYPFNMSQNPACSVPCGFTSDGLPVGLQIVGRRFDDLGVLQVANAFQKATDFSWQRPPFTV